MKRETGAIAIMMTGWVKKKKNLSEWKGEKGDPWKLLLVSFYSFIMII
jgi:hypothetical protein